MRAPVQATVVVLSIVFFSPVGRADYLLWTQVNNFNNPDKVGDVRRSNLDGSDPQILVRGLSGPRGIVADVGSNQMYYADIGRGLILRANLDGSNPTIFESGLNSPFGLALDGQGGLYWADVGTSQITRVNLDRTGRHVVLNTPTPNALALDLSGGMMYWTNSHDLITGHGVIHRANLNGTGAQTIISNVDSFGIAVDPFGGKVYWTEFNGDVFDGGDIRRANLDGSNPQTLVTGLDAPTGITLDLRRSRMYWTDDLGNDIRSANLDGTNQQTIVPDTSVPAQITLVHDLLPGDANDDGQVNFADLLILAQNYGKTTGQTFSTGDFNRDGGVGFDDLLILAQNYGTASGMTAAMPEPSSLVTICVAAATLRRARRR